jgi:hypothetical protein
VTSLTSRWVVAASLGFRFMLEFAHERATT